MFRSCTLTFVHFDVEFNGPKSLRHESLDFLVSLDDKSQSGELTWTVADDAVELAALATAFEAALQTKGLVAREGGAEAQVDLRTSLDGIAKMRIRSGQRAHRIVNVSAEEDTTATSEPVRERRQVRIALVGFS